MSPIEAQRLGHRLYGQNRRNRHSIVVVADETGHGEKLACKLPGKPAPKAGNGTVEWNRTTGLQSHNLAL